MTTPSRVSTFLWFDGHAEQAATFYTALLPNSQVTDVVRGPDGTAFVVGFELDGQAFTALNGGPTYSFTEAVSIHIACPDQAEVDRLWTALTTDGGEEGQCGWLKDRFGLSWQIVPTALSELLSDPATAATAGAALRTMRKIDIDGLRAVAV